MRLLLNVVMAIKQFFTRYRESKINWHCIPNDTMSIEKIIMDYIILKNSADKKMILDDIFFEISRRKSGIEKALKNFSQLEGYIVEGKAICFRKDLDEFELSQLKIPLDNEHVLVF